MYVAAGEKESPSRASYRSIAQAAAAACADAQLSTGAAETMDPVARQASEPKVQHAAALRCSR